MVTWCHTSPLYDVYLFSVKRKPQWTFRLFVEYIVNKNILFRSFLQLNSEEMSIYQCCDIRNLPRKWLIFSWIFRAKSWKFPKLFHLLLSLNFEFSFYTGPRLLWLRLHYTLHCTLTVHIVISDGRVKIDSTDVQRRGKRWLKFTYTCTREV